MSTTDKMQHFVWMPGLQNRQLLICYSEFLSYLAMAPDCLLLNVLRDRHVLEFAFTLKQAFLCNIVRKRPSLFSLNNGGTIIASNTNSNWQKTLRATIAYGIIQCINPDRPFQTFWIYYWYWFYNVPLACLFVPLSWSWCFCCIEPW